MFSKLKVTELHILQKSTFYIHDYQNNFSANADKKLVGEIEYTSDDRVPKFT